MQATDLHLVNRRELLIGALGVGTLTLVGCGGDSGSSSVASSSSASSSSTSSAAATRRWGMGFGFNPPRYTVEDVIKTIDLFASRAEYCIIHEEIPWRDLLAGQSPATILTREKVELVNYLRSRGLRLVFMGDLDDGFNRGQEAPQLIAAGRSITEPSVQQLYRDYMLAVNSMLQPAVLGLVAECNLIRLAAPPTLYAAVKKTANDTAAAIRAAGSQVTLMASVQVETAWGRLLGTSTYTGVETDFTDFPFIQMLGMSAYPYFGWAQPEDLPLNYYTRLLNNRTLPTMVVEGGWASVSAGSFNSSEDAQARYITRQAQLLDNVGASGWMQLNFTDIDIAAFPPPLPPTLDVFTSLGLLDKDYQPKPSLARWDELFARRWQEPS